MKMYCMMCIVIAALLVPGSIAHATVWYVHPDSTLNSIQTGMGLCSTGDTVLVGAGTYMENINFNGMAITVTSEYGPDTTIIDGGSPANPDTGTVVLFISGEDTNSVMKGFTITNGTGTVDPVYGAEGGGILCVNSSPTITDNIICEDSARWGGGIECLNNSNPIISNNMIVNNKADYEGGGIDMAFGASPIIIGNTISGGTAQFAGGISVDSLAQPLIRKNIITDNIAFTYGGGIGCYNNSAATIDSCIISGNTLWGVQSAYSNTQINYCNIIDNLGYDVYNYGPSTIDCENNWWGHATGPYHPTSNPGGQGGNVSDYVDFNPWATGPYPWGVEEGILSEAVDITLQIKPNPFRNSVNITFSTDYNTEAMSLTIYDATGRVVMQLNDLANNQIYWNGTDDFNRRLPSGVYLLQLQAGDRSATEKLLLVR